MSLKSKQEAVRLANEEGCRFARESGWPDELYFGLFRLAERQFQTANATRRAQMNLR